ncbi:hypothetical protein [Polyangium sorediatum]|uniref:Heme oxygenase-like protein n=1 Tax=Polyangium sorediatum TaxID=889274 RepID=A0ABT6NSU0_9BACT|nr:hypothetical protein [Polyangium sorediatum]MDI1431396.1 hypothetical protein [Polyangium sorediatum]
MSIHRVPFEGFSILCEGDTLHYSLPWLSIEAELVGPDKDMVLAGVAQLQKQDYFAPEAQDFLRRLEDYPASYVAPRQGLERKAPPPRRRELPACAAPADILSQVGAPYTMHEWLWDAERIASLSRIEHDAFDPLCAASYLVGRRLEFEVATEPYRRAIEQKLDRLRRLDEVALFDVAKLLIRQTHYITIGLLPTVTIAGAETPRLSGPLEDFMSEERGHDALMARSLSHLGCEDPERIPVLPSTSTLMRLFAFAARHSPIAFASCIGMFEGSSYPDGDPLAELLEKTSIPGAAFGYKAHFEINRARDHKNEVFKLAAALPPSNLAEVLLGVRVFELAARTSQLMDIEINQEIDRAVSAWFTQ